MLRYGINDKVLKFVDDALHDPDPHYTPPTVVFLDPEAKQVLAKVIYEPDFGKRAKNLAKALDDIKKSRVQSSRHATGLVHSVLSVEC